ncbi:uncharacterized protein [Spinacia oleracea]|uniref:Uncharacterized protein isoform X1 n=2 Tax=Spinacia oleracea TaxID=3562 RepID=A0ABM3RFM4_SPIOL|nr:uncharacterized protein LOC110783027 isoform X1 [Spinacia oleracea]XP_056694413.1 uncharacterized protein LOC110783027 isoform X1 [Spinacia oleracea]XP_056694414.1 uncharacterized protein LOC110783027 isoform X1 [Spinacia oleracea]XP_056694415.1 uncharacterized protein LOC110783027 isoform X1 [Spinacia oleracea]XP_056694416.1 uncharacterized protein LOC110783027 isoform X1 [Spinacia oleracea]
MSNLLPGFHFKPTEFQLLNFYLLPKINDEPLPVIPRMLDANIYGDKGDHPSQVFDSFGKSDLEEEDTVRYFFTKLQHVSKKNGVNSKNVIRTVGGYGHWNNARTESIMVKNNQGEHVEVGSKTTLTFKRGKGIVDDHVEWSMIEISTYDSNVVLCKITKKIPKQFSQKRQLQTTSSSIISTTTVDNDGVQGNKRQCVSVQVYQPQEYGVSGVVQEQETNNTVNLGEEEHQGMEDDDDMALFCKGLEEDLSVGDDLNSDDNIDGLLDLCSTTPTTTSASTIVADDGVQGNKDQCVAVQVDQPQECGVLGMVQEQETNNTVNAEQVNFEDFSVGGNDFYLTLEDRILLNSLGF